MTNRLEVLRRAPWSRILLEVVVIMGSILAAFAVDRWWESRSETRREAVLLQALAEDFIQADKDLAAVRTAHTVVGAAQKQLLDYAESGVSPSPNEYAKVDTLVGRQFWRALYEPPMGTLESLIGSGGLDVLSNQQLVIELTRWSSVVDLLRTYQLEARNHFYQHLYPFLRSKIDLEDVDKGFGDFIDFPWHQAPADAYLLMGDREFQNLVYMHWVLQMNSLTQVDNVEASLRRIRTMLSEEMGQTHRFR